MGPFGKNKKKRAALEEAAKKASEARKAELNRVITARPGLAMPSRGTFSTAPTEYKNFIKEVRPLPQSFFEKAATRTQKLGLRPPAGMARRMEENIRTAYMAVTPTGVWSLANRIYVERGQQVSGVEVDRNSMRPISSYFRHPLFGRIGGAHQVHQDLLVGRLQ